MNLAPLPSPYFPPNIYDKLIQIGMTALYAYASPESQKAIMAADDYEGNAGGRAEKIHMIGDRFAVGVLGGGAPLNAIYALQHSHKSGGLGISSVPDLAKKILDITRMNSEELFPELQRLASEKLLKIECYKNILKYASQLVILGCEDVSLHLVDIGFPFPPDDLLDSPVIKELEAGVMHCLGRIGGYNGSVGDDPLQAVRERLSADREKYSGIGDLGSVVEVEGGEVVFHSVYKDVEEIRSGIESLLGCFDVD